jgi:hypothetical protein
LKKDFPEESDLPDSDSTGVEKKRGGVAKSIGELIAKLPLLAPAPQVDPNAFAHAFFEAKQSFQARDSAPRKRTLAERLADVAQQYARNLIDDDEKQYYETEIKKHYFMQE